MSGEVPSDIEIFMAEAADKWVCGSSNGWLVLEGIDGIREVNLWNPLTRRVIQLPSVDTFTIRSDRQGKWPDVPVDGLRYIRKAILSMNPAIPEQDCIVMVIVGRMRTLSYCRIGDKKWMNVEGNYFLPGISDVIYYEGKFYATDHYGVLLSCDNIINPNSIEIVAMGSPYKCRTYGFGMYYLVMASGRLLLVCGNLKNKSFDVYSLDKCNLSYDQWPPYHSYWRIPNKVEICHKWVEIDSIDDQLLFIGNNCSFSLPTQRHGGRANCIYFTDRIYYDNCIGMYDIAKKSTWLYNENDQYNELLPSFWVTPIPW